MKTILVYSGGLDSTVLLYHLIDQGNAVKALSVDYGQRHRKEIDCARAITSSLEIEHRVADLSGINDLLAGSSLTSPEISVPEGHYEEDKMKATVVPNRSSSATPTNASNTRFISIKNTNVSADPCAS